MRRPRRNQHFQDRAAFAAKRASFAEKMRRDSENVSFFDPLVRYKMDNTTLGSILSLSLVGKWFCPAPRKITPVR
jgi:hypothetical protein